MSLREWDFVSPLLLSIQRSLAILRALSLSYTFSHYRALFVFLSYSFTHLDVDVKYSEHCYSVLADGL